MFGTQLDLIIEILGYLVLVTALVSMQIKKMQYLVIWQCMSNVFVVLQLGLRGELSASGVCILGAIETFLIFLFNKREESFPRSLTVLFSIASINVALLVIYINGTFSIVSDLVPIAAAIVFNIAMATTRSSVARLLMLFNSMLWLLLNVIQFSPSLVITYSVLVVTTVVGIVRLDRADWGVFFKKVFGKEKKGT